MAHAYSCLALSRIVTIWTQIVQQVVALQAMPAVSVMLFALLLLFVPARAALSLVVNEERCRRGTQAQP